MRTSLIYAMLIQGFGAVLAILTVFGIARFLGPAAQGSFAIYKNWIEFLSMALLLGAPQGLVYVINKGHASAWHVALWSLRYSLAAAILGFGATLVALYAGYLPADRLLLTAVAITIGCCGYMCHGFARAIFLTSHAGLSFSLLTVLPAAGIVFLLGLQWALAQPDMAIAFSINGALCGLIAWCVLLATIDRSAHRAEKWLAILFRQSLHSFAQSIVLALQPLAVFATIALLGGTTETVGVLSFALVALVAVNALIAMIAPILYNHWSKREGLSIAALRGVLSGVGIGVGLVLMIGLAIAAPAMASVAGPQFPGAGRAILILSLASIPLLLSRLWIPALLAVGRPVPATISSLVRPVVAVAVMAILSAAGTDLVSASSAGWVAAEWFSALLLYVMLDASTKSAPRDVSDMGDLVDSGQVS